MIPLWLFFAPATAAEVSDVAFDQAVTTIERLYLRPDELSAPDLLEHAAGGVVAEVPWLFASTGPDGSVTLRHADGTDLVVTRADNFLELPDALRALTAGIEGAPYPLDPEVDVRLELLEGLSYGLDRYSRVLAGDKLESFDTRLKGTLVGIGATMTLRDDRITIKALTPGGPAEAGGLQISDILARIDGASTVNMPIKEAVRRIRGEADTPVVLEIERDAMPLELTLTRAEIVLPNVTWEPLGDGVGYLRIDHFSQQTTDNLAVGLSALREQGALERGLVLDLRGNTGGSMKQSAGAADAFVTAGMLLRTAGRDGERVHNLQARMDASDDGTEPAVPIALLVDDRTASGSEILAGALVALDRAVVIGAPTYGKGKVQKIYRLDEVARLKLTVAEYLLAGDRAIDGRGIVPDLVLGDVIADGYGVRFRGWEALTEQVAWDAVVPVLYGSRDREDVGREVGRRVVLAAARGDRAAGLDAIDQLQASLRTQREASLVEALAAQGLDWRGLAGEVASSPARVTLRSAIDPDDPDVVLVTAEVVNEGAAPIARARVELVCDTLSAWDDLVVPVGWIDPGATVSGTLAVPLRPGLRAREDVVGARLAFQGGDPIDLGEHVLWSGSSPEPRLALDLRITGADVDRVAEVAVTNLGSDELTGVEVYFEHPGDIGVELVDRAARLPRIAAGAEGVVDLALLVTPEAPVAVPLRVIVEADRYGTLARWTVDVPRDGELVVARPPQISAPRLALSAPTGARDTRFTVQDDRGIDHVVVWLDGEKVAWSGPASGGLDVRVPAELHAGANLFTVVATDDQGLVTRETFALRGEPAVSVDAGEP